MLTKDNTYAVMRLFFDAPEKSFHIREIARLTKLSAPGVLKIISKLKKENLVTSRRENIIEAVRASKTERFFRLKTYYNIEKLFESGLITAIRNSYQEPEAIVLFGSAAKGEDTSESDVDIAVVAPKEIEFSTAKFEKVLKKKINIYAVKTKTAEPAFLNSLANGIVLFGFLKVV